MRVVAVAYYSTGRVEIMALVYKAFSNKEGGTTFICFNEYINDVTKLGIIERKLPLTKSRVFISKYDEHIDIPKEYKISGMSGGNIESTDFDLNLILKDMHPEEIFNLKSLYKGVQLDIGDWVMYNGKPLCVLPRLNYNSDGWSISDNILHYHHEVEVYIMREIGLRHKQDKEYDDVTINLSNGTCIHSSRSFSDTIQRDVVSKFDMKYKLWKSIKTSIKEDIISVKRM